jgi:hypothetical protein
MCAFWKKKKNHYIETHSLTLLEQRCTQEGREQGCFFFYYCSSEMGNGYSLSKVGRLLSVQEIGTRKGIGGNFPESYH